MTSEEVHALLVSEGKGGILDPKTIQHNLFFALFEYDGKQMCRAITNGKVEFFIADCWERNAVAIESLSSVVVFKGMLEAIFSIAAKIVDKGIFPSIGDVITSQPRFDPRKSLLTKRELLISLPPFDLEINKPTWFESPERQTLFMFIANTLFRFVTMHELGHLYHQHGKRSSLHGHYEFDELGAEEPDGSISAQAREIIADSFAFQHLAEFQLRHLLSERNTPVGSLLASHFMKSEDELLQFISQIIFIYFYMMESPNWAHREPAKWTHPPAQFRLQTIFASLLEHGLVSVHKEMMPKVLENALFLGPSITSLMFDIFPEYNWMRVLDQPKYRAHYEDILTEIPIWWKDDNRWESLD
ncbi:hypothetical protein IQ288_31680 [Burkholderia sp. R-69980]|nr:hypothetical protein [Burkholderia sp. R-69980]